MLNAEIKPIVGKRTIFDVLVEKYHVKDSIVEKIKDIICDHESNEENPEGIGLKETLGACYILKDWKRLHGRITKSYRKRLQLWARHMPL